jgi:hypothetical protein
MALNNGWIRIDTDSGSGDTAITATVLERNTGRSVTRSVTIAGHTTHGATAYAVIKQEPAEPFIVADYVESLHSHEIMQTLPYTAGDYLLVGHANVDFMSAEETSDNYTDMNDLQHGRVWENGFTIIENGNTYHGELEQEITYGSSEQYTFKIPFYAEDAGKLSRSISFVLEDNDSHSTTFEIIQEGELSN